MLSSLMHPIWEIHPFLSPPSLHLKGRQLIEIFCSKGRPILVKLTSSVQPSPDMRVREI